MARCHACSPDPADSILALCDACKAQGEKYRAVARALQEQARRVVDDAREADNVAQARDAQDASEERAEHQALCWYCLDFVGPDIERRRRCRERRAADAQRAARRVA